MNRKILIQVTTPAVVIGLLLFGVCLLGVWSLDRLQTNLASILTDNVTSLEASQELEIAVRQLRFHSFFYLIDPSKDRRQLIDQDQEQFEKALLTARRLAKTADQVRCVDLIEEGYHRYKAGNAELLAIDTRNASRDELAKLADDHPVRHFHDLTQALLSVNKQMMERTAEQSRQVSRWAHVTMILLGLVGPVSGLLTGYGIARTLSHSIYRLGVRVRDMASRLDLDVASVSIEANGDIQGLNQQLEYVVRRVEEVTEQQQQHQRDMLRAEQLSAVGQLAANVAHEVRNPLTSVKMLVEFALRSENRKPLSLDDLRVIHRAIARLEQTVQGFLDFARPPAPLRCACDLRREATQAVELVQARARQQKVDVAVHLPEAEVRGDVDRGQFGTVLVNLLLNALDAMPLGGRMELNLESSPSLGTSLTVADSGTGIAPEVADRLFTPFISTKPTGTGLGLSISRRIVEEHGGHLTACNRPGGGASFTITLPTVGQSAVEPIVEEMNRQSA